VKVVVATTLLVVNEGSAPALNPFSARVNIKFSPLTLAVRREAEKVGSSP
jgi:hypothetical protein